MAPPISQVRSMYERLSGAASESVVETVRTLSPSSLASAVRDRAAVAVPVGEGLRRAAWCGLAGSLLAAFVSPFAMRSLDRGDWLQSIILTILDRGRWWWMAAVVCSAVGLVAMVFTNGARRATRPGLVGLSGSSVVGIIAGLPSLLAVVVAVVAGLIAAAFVMMVMWVVIGALCSALND